MDEGKFYFQNSLIKLNSELLISFSFWCVQTVLGKVSMLIFFLKSSLSKERLVPVFSTEKGDDITKHVIL